MGIQSAAAALEGPIRQGPETTDSPRRKFTRGRVVPAVSVEPHPPSSGLVSGLATGNPRSPLKGCSRRC